VSTTYYVLNNVLIIPFLKLTPYEFFKGRKPNISHLRVFRCKCFVLNNGKFNIDKFDLKVDEIIFFRHSLTSKTCRLYNKRTLTIKESIHVVFYECCEHKDKLLESRKSVKLVEIGVDLIIEPHKVQMEKPNVDTISHHTTNLPID